MVLLYLILVILLPCLRECFCRSLFSPGMSPRFGKCFFWAQSVAHVPPGLNVRLYNTFGYLGRVLTSWWHEGFHHSPRTPGDRPRSPCGRWPCAPQTLSSWHLLSPPPCTWGTDKNIHIIQQAEMETEHRHHWHWPNHLPCCWTNSLTMVSLSVLQLWIYDSPHCHPLLEHA